MVHRPGPGPLSLTGTGSLAVDDRRCLGGHVTRLRQSQLREGHDEIGVAGPSMSRWSSSIRRGLSWAGVIPCCCLLMTTRTWGGCDDRNGFMEKANLQSAHTHTVLTLWMHKRPAAPDCHLPSSGDGSKWATCQIGKQTPLLTFVALIPACDNQSTSHIKL